MKLWQKASVVTLFALIASLINSEELSFVVAGALILVLGIPHGASDLVIFNFLKQSRLRTEVSPLFLVSYFSLIGVYLVMWILFPKLSFVAFLILSSYHFGETQFFYLSITRWQKNTISITWGIAVLLIMLLPHLDVLQEWLLPIVDNEAVFGWLGKNRIYLEGAGIVLSLGAIIAFAGKALLKELIEFILLIFLFNNTGILIGFSAFFCFWHSWDALKLQLFGLQRIKRGLNLFEFLKKTMPITLISIAGLITLTVLSFTLELEISWIIVFFVLIALLTLPHSFLISRFYDKLKLNR